MGYDIFPHHHELETTMCEMVVLNSTAEQQKGQTQSAASLSWEHMIN